MSHIELRDVGKRYAERLPWAIHRVDLDIAPGEFCVFVGPSGCGKSTLLRMVAGLEAITHGVLSMDGARMNEVPAARRGVAMVFQSYALYPHMSVYENMAFGLRVNGVSGAELDRQVRRAAQILQLEPLLQRMPKALSGGQRQRVAIGRAIVKQPKVFLFDEPLSNLDAALRASTRMEIARLHRDMGSASMIYVTHDQVEAMTLAQKIVLLHAGDDIATQGSVAQVGSPLSLYHRPQRVFVAEFIGSPRINLLPGTLLGADERRARVAIGDVQAEVAVDARHLSPGAAVRVGVRPEHARLGGVEGAAIGGRITHIEQFGDSATLVLETQGGLFSVRTDGYADQRLGASLPVTLPPESLHLFDADGRACRRTVDLPG